MGNEQERLEMTEEITQKEIAAKACLAMKDLVETIERGDAEVVRMRAGQLGEHGKGEQPPKMTGIWAFEIHYKQFDKEGWKKNDTTK